MDFFKRHRKVILGILVGMFGGYLYWYFIGCVSGTCAITSSPVNSSVYGALMGGLLANSFKKEATRLDKGTDGAEK